MRFPANVLSRLILAAAGCLLAAGGCGRPASRAANVDGAPSEVTFSRDIAPIVFAKCASCHRPGEAAPFSLLTYEDLRRRASQIAEVTRKRIMPPWLPRDGYGEFRNARLLTEPEIESFSAWAAGGAPLGDESLLPDPPNFTTGWQLGPPELVLETPPYTLRGEGGDQFRNFVVPTELASPRWVQAIEIRPENARVTHHARLGIDTSFESVRRDAADLEPGYDGMAWGADPDGQLVTWTPGMIPSPGMPGAAWRLHPKTYLVLHTHLQPSGKNETVRFRIGVHFATESPTIRPVILRIGSRDIDIPAGDAHHVVVDEFVLPVAVDIHSIFPHAHSLCKEARVRAQLADGSHQPLIWIEQFDENWHDNYRYAEPVRLPRGTRIVTEFTYDNSDANIRNRRHPPQRTVYGSNAADEMEDVYLQVTAVEPDERAALLEYIEGREQQSNLVGYRKTLDAYPDDDWSREGLAACYLALGKPRDAIQMLEARLASGPSEVHTLAMLGVAHFANRDFGRAEAFQRQAIETDPQYPLAWLSLGRALGAQHKVAEAEQGYRRALELAPALTDAHLDLAELLLQQERLDEAAATCETANEVSPDLPNVLLKLAEIRTRQRRYDEGLRLFEEARRLAPYTHPPKALSAVYCLQSGEPERARKLLAEARADQPNHPVPALFLGQLARNEQRTDTARHYLDAAASLPLPTNWPASHCQRFLTLLHSERFQLAQQLKDIDLARDALTQWIKCEPENEKLRQLLNQLQSSAMP